MNRKTRRKNGRGDKKSPNLEALEALYDAQQQVQTAYENGILEKDSTLYECISSSFKSTEKKIRNNRRRAKSMR